MSVTITINNCDECQHVDHSGAFTPGGAKPICGNSDACHVRCHRDKWHWKNRVLHRNSNGNLVIPTWCPLKHGA
jgi:hypothetical protein